jgi:hypothetical protein
MATSGSALAGRGGVHSAGVSQLRTSPAATNLEEIRERVKGMLDLEGRPNDAGMKRVLIVALIAAWPMVARAATAWPGPLTPPRSGQAFRQRCVTWHWAGNAKPIDNPDWADEPKLRGRTVTSLGPEHAAAGDSAYDRVTRRDWVNPYSRLFGAALVVLAIVLLAIAGPVTMADAKQPNNFGLPPDIAAKVKAECAKVFPFYDTQITCIEDDAKAYHRLQKNDFGLPPEIAEQVKVRCAEIFPFYDTQITCIEDDARAYKKLHGED